jgi:hypothetical protein
MAVSAARVENWEAPVAKMMAIAPRVIAISAITQAAACPAASIFILPTRNHFTMVALTGKRNSLNMEMDGSSLGTRQESFAIIARNDTTPVS